MQQGRCIPHDRLRAYQLARYRIHGTPAFNLRIAQCSDALLHLYPFRGCHSAALITAHNPGGQKQSRWKNQCAQRALIHQLDDLGLPQLPGSNFDRAHAWPPEPTRLVLGIPLPLAQEIGAQFQQDAILWAGADAIPRLILLRAAGRALS